MSEALPLVITTIQPPTACVEAFAALKDVRPLIVGDAKTPDAAYAGDPRWGYLSLDDQLAMRSTLAPLLPENHYARKNLGYLHAIRSGTRLLAESDDDNRPLAGWLQSISLMDQDQADTVIEKGPSNLYRCFSSRQCWPRGFPLDTIAASLSQPAPRTQRRAARIRVIQGLANGAPDVDAIHRLVFSDDDIEFEERPPVALGRETWCPFNSQNTFWHRDAFAYLYLPAFVSFRFTDILRSYVAQRGLAAMGAQVAFTGATVFQERNPHDYLRDFEQEVPVYLLAGKVIRILTECPLNGNPFEDLKTMYARLHEHEVVNRSECEAIEAWIADLENSGLA